MAAEPLAKPFTEHPAERSPIRVFLADDHALIREGLKRLIEEQTIMKVGGEAGSGRETWERVKALSPDIVVMDISMPDMNGVEATENIKRDCPNVKVLALSAHEDEAYFRRTLRAGASGFVLKRAISEELIHALNVVFEGGIYVCAIVASKIVGAYSDSNSDLQQDDVLSVREGEVLRYIAWGHTNKEIATTLFISVKTVETHRALHGKTGLAKPRRHRALRSRTRLAATK